MNGTMCTSKHPASCSGLTLVELMITLVILSISILMVTPSMQGLLQDNRLRAEAGRLVAAVNLARSEAVSRNISVSLCPSLMADSGVPTCGGHYAQGWIVFSNANRDRVVDHGTDELIQASAGIPRGYTLTNRAGTRAASELLTFMPDGSTRQNRTLLLCPPPVSLVESRAVVLNMVGRARIGKGEGQCPPAVI